MQQKIFIKVGTQKIDITDYLSTNDYWEIVANMRIQSEDKKTDIPLFDEVMNDTFHLNHKLADN